MKKELEYFRMLKNAGFSHKQAETHLKVVKEAMQENFATKFDLYGVRTELKDELQELNAKIDKMDNKFERKLDSFNNKFNSLNNKFEILEYKIIHKIGLMFVAATGVLAALATLFKFVF